MGADRRVEHTAALRGPGEAQKIQPVFKQQCNAAAQTDAQRTKRLRATIRQVVKLRKCQRLSRLCHPVGNLVRMALCKCRYVFQTVSPQVGAWCHADRNVASA